MNVRKLVFVMTCLLLVAGTSIYAQDSRFRKGDVALNFNYSAGNFRAEDFDFDEPHSHYDFFDSYYQHGFGLTMEVGVIGDVINEKGCIAIGAEAGFGFGRNKEDYTKELSKRIHIATRGSLHYSFIPEIATYAGLKLGVANWSDYNLKMREGKNDDWEEIYDGKLVGKFIYPTFFCGARYMAAQNFGFNVEFSYDRFAYASVGITIKM